MTAATAERARLLEEMRRIAHDPKGVSLDRAAEYRRLGARLDALGETLEPVLTLEAGVSPAPARDADALAPGQSVADWARARGHADPDARLSLGRYVRGLATGDWAGAAEERALAEGAVSSGGALVPTPLATEIIDLARNRARVIRAGATTVPMTSETLKVAKLTGDPQPAWRAENSLVAEDDATFDQVTLAAKSLSVVVRASREVLEDAINLEQTLRGSLSAAFALELDRAALYGDPAGAGDPDEPTGVRHATGVTLTPLAAAPADYDYLIDALGVLEDANHEATGVIGSPRTARQLAKLVTGIAGDKTKLAVPRVVAAVPRLSTNQVPVNLDDSLLGNNDESNDFVGEWRHLYVGMRTQIGITVLRERYADLGQVGFWAWMRADVQLAQPAAFNVVTDIRP